MRADRLHKLRTVADWVETSLDEAHAPEDVLSILMHDHGGELRRGEVTEIRALGVTGGSTCAVAGVLLRSWVRRARSRIERESQS